MATARWLCAIGIVLSTTAAVAATAEEPGLKEIMQGLRDELASVSSGLLTDDFDQVAQAAARIAHHAPVPVSQAQLIAAELGPEMAAFEQFDEVVHERSLSLAAAANERNRERTIADYQRLVNGCLACHAAYKNRIAAALR